MPPRFSVTDYRKQRYRKSRLQKQKRQKPEDWKPTRHNLWSEKSDQKKISGETHILLYSILITGELGSLLYMLAIGIKVSLEAELWVVLPCQFRLGNRRSSKRRWAFHRKHSFLAKMFQRKRIWLRNHTPAFTPETGYRNLVIEDFHVNSLAVPFKGGCHIWNRHAHPVLMTLANKSIPDICHFFSKDTTFGSPFLHTKLRKSQKNNFHD